MRIAIEKRKRVTVASIDGSVDGTTAAGLVAALRKQINGGNSRLKLPSSSVRPGLPPV